MAFNNIRYSLRELIAKIPMLEKLVLQPWRTFRLHSYYRSLLPLAQLDEASRNMWLGRIDKVKRSSDNQRIAKINQAGTLQKGKLVMHNGLIIDPLSYYGAPVMRMLMENQAVHEPQEEYVFQEVLKYIPENATMLEVGCYWGFYSMWFASKIKGAKNYLADNADGIARAKANFKMNGLQATFITGYIGRDVADSPVAITNVDRICQENNIEFLDIMHADIQGYEMEMLETMPELLSKNGIGYFFISTHSNELHQSCIEFLKSKGFLILCHADLNDSFSEDGLIVARNPSYPGPDVFEISLMRKQI
ncbi:MAG: FkbM family methyltransferase [Bacteroidia bacterium]|nr:FkbM family methyltransferase [Bacteroidia bacterium]